MFQDPPKNAVFLEDSDFAPEARISPKNRYLFNATISEEDTETLVWLYVQGLMAAGVADFYKLDFGERAETAKHQND